MIYLQLFWSFFQIGILSFGGGYAVLPLIQNQLVEIHGWMTPGQFADLVALSQMTPGAIAINGATFAGIQVAGLPGALVATLGCVCPSLLLVTLLALFYQKYRESQGLHHVMSVIRPVVVGLIAASGLTLAIRAVCLPGQRIPVDFLALGLVLLGVLLLHKTRLPLLVWMALAGLAGVAGYGLVGITP